MQIGLNSGIFPATWNPSQKIEASARVGAEAMELNIDANQLWTQRLDSSARNALRKQAADAGVSISSLCINAHWVFNFASPDVRIRDLGVSILLDAIQMASDLGAGAILVPGCDQDESPANKWELFRDGVMHAITHAQQAGIKLALEAVGKPFLLSTQKLLEMIDACGGSETLGIYLDVGNSTSSGLDPVAEIQAARGRAVLTHVKDWNPNNTSERRLGAGAVNFPAAIEALRSIDYNGPLLIELPPDLADPDRVARESVQFMRGVLHE